MVLVVESCPGVGDGGDSIWNEDAATSPRGFRMMSLPLVEDTADIAPRASPNATWATVTVAAPTAAPTAMATPNVEVARWRHMARCSV